MVVGFVIVMVSIFPLRLGNVTLDTGSVREAEGWQHYCFLAACKDRTCFLPIADKGARLGTGRRLSLVGSPGAGVELRA